MAKVKWNDIFTEWSRLTKLDIEDFERADMDNAISFAVFANADTSGKFTIENVPIDPNDWKAYYGTVKEKHGN